MRERRTEGLSSLQDQWTWLSELRLKREALENAWNQWFLSYSADRQRALMSRIGLAPNLENVAAVAIGVFSLLLGALAIFSLRRKSVRDPLADIAFELRGKLARRGIAVPSNMGLHDMQEYLSTRLDAASMADARRLLADLAQARYARPPAGQPGPSVRDLRAAVRRWRPVPAGSA